MAISLIEKRSGAWYDLYDEQGQKYKTLSASSTGDVLGWSSTFFIALRCGAWYELYDASGRKYKTLSAKICR